MNRDDPYWKNKRHAAVVEFRWQFKAWLRNNDWEQYARFWPGESAAQPKKASGQKKKKGEPKKAKPAGSSSSDQELFKLEHEQEMQSSDDELPCINGNELDSATQRLVDKRAFVELFRGCLRQPSPNASYVDDDQDEELLCSGKNNLIRPSKPCNRQTLLYGEPGSLVIRISRSNCRR